MFRQQTHQPLNYSNAQFRLKRVFCSHFNDKCPNCPKYIAAVSEKVRI